MRVAKIPYLNSQPFYGALGGDDAARIAELRAGGIDLIEMPPAELGRLAREGRIDAGLIPVADWFALESRGSAFERLGDFGIAARGRVESVLLLSEKPIDRLAGARVGVTEETSTSFLLLRLLLEARHRASPSAYLRGVRDSVDASLLIGDEALAATAKGGAAPFVFDLAEEWESWQGLPFVFAVWVVRQSLPHIDKARLASLLDQSLFGAALTGESGSGGRTARVAEKASTGAGAERAARAREVASAAALDEERERETASYDERNIGALTATQVPRGASPQVIAAIARAYATGPAARRKLGNAERTTNYLSRFIYRLGPTEEIAVDLFRRLLGEHGIRE